jgi:DNA repair protein RecN (Recombination protein N)
VLHELKVENLLLIEDARLELSPGLNVLTGETGAGKTVLAHALDLLLGGRARAGIVRPGAAEAYVEGIFALPPDLPEQLPAGAEELVLARRVSADGRTRAYLNGRSIAVGELRDIAAGLLSFYGQHEHRRLTVAASQLDVLDDFCGPQQLARRERCAERWQELRAAEAELARLRELEGARERELDLIQFELSEIDAVAPDPAEHEGLLRERERLRNLAALHGAAWSAGEALGAEDGGAAALLAGAAAALAPLDGVDAELDALAARAQTLTIEAQDLLSGLRTYGEGLEGEPGRLEAVEERLAATARLERKHGGSIEAVLEHAERSRARRDELAGVAVALDGAQTRLDELRSAHAREAKALRSARSKQAPRLADAVRSRLAELAMADAEFAVELLDTEPGPRGADSVQFTIAANRGVPPAPLRDVASGGELSRVMLALLGAASAGGDAALVFDEIDAGIGGHTARAVGEQLKGLADGRQVVCITHLPQVASLAARHFTIVKDAGSDPARAIVTRLKDADVVEELARMLGAEEGDRGARRHARELMRAA